MSEPAPPVVVFDLGGVLVDWNPRYLYRKLIADERVMEHFLGEVCNDAWNVQQDAGRPFAVALDEAIARHPAQRPLIEAYWERWSEMLAGPIAGTVDVLQALHAAGIELHAITNWSAETFPVARERYDFLGWFGTVVVSGEEGLVKPDRRIFDRMLARIGRRAAECVYIDDSLPNVVMAELLGFDVVHFQDPPRLAEALAERGLPVDLPA